MAEIDQWGGRLVLGSRLRRLTERFAEESARIFQAYDVPMEPRWFPVFFMLAHRSDMSSTEIAEAIGHSRPSVSQILTDLKRAGLVDCCRSEEDGRATLNVLTEAGRDMAARVLPQFQDVAGALDDLAEEVEHDLWRAMDEMERALDRESLTARVKRRRAAREGEALVVAPLDGPGDAAAFKALNLEWIERYFEVEPKDAAMLDDPEASVLSGGGRILMARLGGETVGTCALIRHDEETVELAKMAVSPMAQGQGVGRRLGEAAVAVAREMGAARLVLETNSKLEAAIALYRRLGFKDMDGPRSAYARCNVQMSAPLR